MRKISLFLCFLLFSTNLMAQDATHVFGGVAHTTGFGNTIWRTDIVVLNPTDSTISVKVFDTPTDTELLAFYLDAYSYVLGLDLVTILRLQDGSYSVKFVIYGPNANQVIISPRTYNFLPGVEGTNGVTLPPLMQIDQKKFVIFDKRGNFRNALYIVVNGVCPYKISYFDSKGALVSSLDNLGSEPGFYLFTPPQQASYGVVFKVPGPGGGGACNLYAYTTSVDNTSNSSNIFP